MVKEKNEESKLKEFKEKYNDIKKKYSLPDFNDLNREFSIEKVADIETDFLIREIGKIIAEKFSNYLRFSEMMLNPVNAPMFIFSMMKAIGEEEKKKLSEMYKELTKIEFNMIELDADFSEKKQADFINDSYKSWLNIKKEFMSVLEKIKSNWDSKKENNNKAYFG